MRNEISKGGGHEPEPSMPAVISAASRSIKDVLRITGEQEMAKESARGPLLGPKLQRQFQRLELMLKDSGRSCEIELMGVVHDWEAGQEIIRRARDAQIVTLELTRNIVNAGLADNESRILERNLFWGSLVKALRSGNNGQLIKGIEVNQTVRVAWKRLALHHGDRTLAPSFFTFELKNTDSKDLRLCQERKLLDEQDILKLQRYNWAIVENEDLSCVLMRAVTDALDQLKKGEFGKVWPMQITEDLYLATYSKEKPFDGRYLTTFIKKPDRSLLRAEKLVENVLAELPLGLTRAEREWISLVALQDVILSYAELKDAEEIFNCLYQYARKHEDGGHLHLLHIGGSAHSEAIRQVLQSSITGASSIKISVAEDPRFKEPQSDVSFTAFFHDHIPFGDLLTGVKAKGFEVYADPERIAEMVRNAITDNQEEFDRRLFIGRMTERDGKEHYTLAQFKELNRKLAGLGELYPGALRVEYLSSIPELRSGEV